MSHQRTAVLVGGAAVASSLVTLAAVFGWQRVRRIEKKRDVIQAAHASTVTAMPAAEPVQEEPAEHDDDLVREQLSRNYAFLGDEGMAKIRDSFVVVVGAGGVGSWAALMLLRSGVKRLRIIDFDQVSLSSLNRHACATLADVGRPKVVCCASFFRKIAPWAHIEPVVELFCAEHADRLLGGEPTYVVDAIDNLSTKVELLRYCYTHDLRVFASMGAGAKADPSRIQISDISTTAEDPLARTVRRELRALGIPPVPPTGAEAPRTWSIPCVYSTEKSDTRLLPLDESEVEKGDVNELAAFEDFRVRILPVLGPLPAMFGLAAATYIICDIAGHEMEPLAVKGRRRLYEKLFSDLNVLESRYPSPEPSVPLSKSATADDVPAGYREDGRSAPPPRIRIPFSVNDCAYIFEEVFRGRTVVPPCDSLSNGQIMRWDASRPLDYDNVVLLDRRQARIHESRVLKDGEDPAAVWGAAVADIVAKRMAEERRMSRWR
ncbi:hypothetical protein MCUN1_003907 [Malassezia cuniculi]|uniref:THIF-type NAD/FAD binding fold domain-containing protein n=1 Tax=Malassezia cuniculi TaxID=948313 RepID=A0AAF0EUD7_9BASI|nr:hypothetical protein MCUN1_003907 [Malassezia cuniculi]